VGIDTLKRLSRVFFIVLPLELEVTQAGLSVNRGVSEMRGDRAAEAVVI
jgi:hypothetical protein